MAKKAAWISAGLVVAFAALMLVFHHLQEKTRAECLAVLGNAGITETQWLDDRHPLDKGADSNLIEHLPPDLAPTLSGLLAKRREYAYWSAVSRGVAQVALLLLILLGARKICSKITVPAWLYRKFWKEPEK